MKTFTKAVIAAAFLSLTAGTAVAAESAAMDCCKKCECCKDKAPGTSADKPADKPHADHK